MTSLVQMKGVVKQVVSGDTIVVRSNKGIPPPEKKITFLYVQAPKLAQCSRTAAKQTMDEPWAWEAREFLRKKLIGQDVMFTFQKPQNTKQVYGYVYLGKNVAVGENVVQTMLKEGLITVRPEYRQSAKTKLLVKMENWAKTERRGQWSDENPTNMVRCIKWTHHIPSQLVERYRNQTVSAIIEKVLDGSIVRALLLPEFHFITLIISGIRCPGTKYDSDGKPRRSPKLPFADEAKYFVESQLLHREVEIQLEGVVNYTFIGNIIYDKGNIAELLLREGLAKCVEWSLAIMKSGADKLVAAEQEAKDNRVRLWRDYKPIVCVKEDFIATVVEVLYADAIIVKTVNDETKRVYFSSIQPPRITDVNKIDIDEELSTTKFCALYDIPYMFDAREFLRILLIGKKVHCTLDYVSPARDNLQEKYCYTVLIGDHNVAVALVAKGLASCMRYRHNYDQRSPAYDELLAAETRAISGQMGIHSKMKKPRMHISDLTVDYTQIKVDYLPLWQRAYLIEGIVEFIRTGLRICLYIPKDNCLVSLLLADIFCPRQYHEKALVFIRDHVMQQNVSVRIQTTDKAGSSVIGWLWTSQKINLSVALVEEGFAMVHLSAEQSDYYHVIMEAEKYAKERKKIMWAEGEEKIKKQVKNVKNDKISDQRQSNYLEVIITEIMPRLIFYAQTVENATKLEELQNRLRAEFQLHPPTSYTYIPCRGDMCAAQYSLDNLWYRGIVQTIGDNNATILFIDYGNKEIVPFNRLAALCSPFNSEEPFATKYKLSLMKLPCDKEDREKALCAFAAAVSNRKITLKVEMKPNFGPALVTLYDPDTNIDIGEQLIADGLVLVKQPKKFPSGTKLQNLLQRYKTAERAAFTARLAIWKYGDTTQYNAPKFNQEYAS